MSFLLVILLVIIVLLLSTSHIKSSSKVNYDYCNYDYTDKRRIRVVAKASREELDYLGKLFINIRRANNLTVKELSSKISVQDATLKSIESGNNYQINAKALYWYIRHLRCNTQCLNCKEPCMKGMYCQYCGTKN